MKSLIITLLCLTSMASVATERDTLTHAIHTITTQNPNDRVFDKEPYQDIDQDGVIDKYDFCQNSEKGYKVDKNGCEPDTDKDGVYDRTDQCPATQLGAKVNLLGCEGDEDLDGVLDSQDQCPRTSIGAVVNAKGCSANTNNDNDNDGVLNLADQCPATPIGKKVNRFGCQPKAFVITHIIFNTGSYEIRADQRPILDKDISQLQDADFDQFIVITGHTDSVGTSARNEQLSWNRAQSVKNYFVMNMNYDASKILVLGEGEYSPSASNSTKEGRQQNRRIEFSIIDKDKVPARAELQIPVEMKGYTRYPNR